jgi:chemotaxis protein CheZ
MVSLHDAQQLVALLESGEQQQADQLFEQMATGPTNPMLQQVGELTRDLHDSLKQFNIEQRMSEIAIDEIPEARDRLQYVLDKTEDAANKTMDAVDASLPIADQLNEKLTQIRPKWNDLMHGRIELNEFKTLCHSIDALLVSIEGDSVELRSQLTHILMAQDFQDLTGQIIRRVITLVGEVEERLVDILTAFGVEEATESAKTAKEKCVEAEGPIIDAENRDDAVSSQDDVDDLLASLGF